MSVLRPLLLAWGGLLLLLAVQIGTAMLLRLPMVAPLFGMAATAIVVVAFMRIRDGSSLMHIFGLAGLFWLIVLLTLGTMDPVTRVDVLAPITTVP